MKRAVFLFIILFLLFLTWPSSNNLRVATFNIADFPRNDQQVELAFNQIRDLDIDLIALQEVMDPERIMREASSRLGNSWYFVVPSEEQNPERRVALLYNDDRLELIDVIVDEGTRLDKDYRPILMGIFRDRQDDTEWGFATVHLKAGGDSVHIREQQYRALRFFLYEDYGPEELILMGDFNATSERDRENIEDLAFATGMEWPTEELACTSFWKTRNKCEGSALDHAVSTSMPEVRLEGVCKREGCVSKDQCPVEWYTLSDHCPIVFEFN